MIGQHQSSERTTRTTTGHQSSPIPKNTPHPDPDDLERNYSDDSSVFSGLVDHECMVTHDCMPIMIDELGSAQSIGKSNSESPRESYPQQHREYEHRESPSQVRANPKGILRKSLNDEKATKLKSAASIKSRGSSMEESEVFSDDHTDSIRTDRSQRSMLREMPPMVDSDTLFGQNSVAENSYLGKHTSGSTTFPSANPSADSLGHYSSGGRSGSGGKGSTYQSDQSSSGPSSGSSMSELMSQVKTNSDNDSPSLFPDEDTFTQMTWASAQDMNRPKGTVKLVSSVTFQEQNQNPPEYRQKHPSETRQPIEETHSDDSSSRIVEILSDFEKQMDENLKIIQDDNVDNQGDVLSELQDVAPRRTKTEEDLPVLTPHKARKLQRILHKARKEVEVLRDNNEQYKSEIEQMEEEHKSELKLIDDRAKQKISELKSMYQDEMESLTREKDAALIEAGRQAARYAESGKKQVTSMKKQLEKLKATATATIQEKVGEAARIVMTKKDQEITARLGALRKSYESELEKVRKECDDRVRSEVESAVSSVAQRVRLNQDVLISELRDQIDKLRKERRTITDMLDSVKINFEKHYPDEMKLYVKKSQDFPGCARRLLENQISADNAADNVLKDVIETFAFLLEITEKKVSAEKDMTENEVSKKERAEVYAQLRKELLIRHKAEIEHFRKEKGEAQEKIKVLEESFRNLGREKRFVEDKHRKVMESHRLELEKIRTEKDAFLNIERSRKELALAVAAGERKLAAQSEDKETHLTKLNPSQEVGLPAQLPYSAKHNKPRELDSDFVAATGGVQLTVVGTATETAESDNSRPRCFSEHSRTSISEHSMSHNGSEHSRAMWESASVRKARSFQRKNPYLSPRHSSPRNRLALFDEPVAAHDPSNQNGKSTTTTDASVALELLYSQERNIPEMKEQEVLAAPATGQRRNSVDPSPQANISDGLNISNRSKHTILSNLRIQSKKASDAEKEIPAFDPKLDPSGEDLTKVESDEFHHEAAMKRKGFAILRSFKANKETPRKDPAQMTSTSHGKEPEGKIESTNIMTRSLRRARSLKTYFNPGKCDEGLPSSRQSLDGSVSSLQTSTGAGTAQEVLAADNAHRYSLSEDSQQNAIDARQSKKFLESNLGRTQTVAAIDVSEQLSKSAKKINNTLGLFVQSKHSNVPGGDTEPSQIRNDIESYDNNSRSKRQNHGARSGETSLPATESDIIHERSSEESNIISQGDIDDYEGGCGPLREASHLNLKQALPQESHDERIKPSEHVTTKTAQLDFNYINGRKPGPVPENEVDTIFTMRNSSEDSDTENAIPTVVSVPSPTKNSREIHGSSGHTLLCQPLSVKYARQSRHPPRNISNLSGVTSETMPSSEEEGGGLLFDSQAQMRKFPPLTDESDEDSAGAETQDKYETCDSPKLAGNRASGALDGNAIPLGISRGTDESPIDSINSSEERRIPTVGQGLSIYRPPGLASFRPTRQYLEDTTRKLRQDPSDATSTAGSSVSTATTTITAHTMKSSVIRAPKGDGMYSSRRSLPSTNSTLTSSNHNPSGSTRFAALKARVRVRRSDTGLAHSKVF